MAQAVEQYIARTNELRKKARLDVPPPPTDPPPPISPEAQETMNKLAVRRQQWKEAAATAAPLPPGFFGKMRTLTAEEEESLAQRRAVVMARRKQREEELEATRAYIKELDKTEILWDQWARRNLDNNDEDNFNRWLLLMRDNIDVTRNGAFFLRVASENMFKM